MRVNGAEQGERANQETGESVRGVILGLVFGCRDRGGFGLDGDRTDIGVEIAHARSGHAADYHMSNAQLQAD